jgi:cytochrome o ubiquinol oxidase subunit III
MSTTDTLAEAVRPRFDPHRLGRARNRFPFGGGGGGDRHATGHGEGGPASKSVIVGYGFWIFILSDIVMFSAFFAAFAVLSHATAGGPSGKTLFDLRNTAFETAFLLISSFTCGLATIAVEQRSQLWTQVALLVTGLFGLGFILLEAREFAGLVAQGDAPTRSAFLSSFFTLVGCHGVHVSLGLLWLGTMMAQFWAKGFRQTIRYRFLCFSLFWHALDIIWVAIFTLVYLMGARG